MQRILLLGAGRSATSLIRYLTTHLDTDDLHLTVADLSEALARQKTGSHSRCEGIGLDIQDNKTRYAAISKAHVVISLLPPALHAVAAADCVEAGIPLVTASYVSPAINALDEAARKKGILIMNECGLDPGIDHMSAMQVIDELKGNKAELHSFKSYTGGLVAPAFVDNPWGYKFTWNPKNVILAGQGTAKYIEENQYRYLPYSRLFTSVEKLEIDGRMYDGYANRDSLAYRHHYGLENIPTLLRGTLRQEGFCNAWNAFVKCGLTDDQCIVEKSEQLTYSQLMDAFLPKGNGTVKEKLASLMNWEHNSREMQMIESTGVFSDEKCGLHNATSAQMLQYLLELKWKLKSGDRDMILMQHQFIYKLQSKMHRHVSTLTLEGEDQLHTAMAKTVGYPLGIVARLILKNKIPLTGVHIPVQKVVYDPVMAELKTLGIEFKESREEI